jgi:hypothetical protein
MWRSPGLHYWWAAGAEFEQAELSVTLRAKELHRLPGTNLHRIGTSRAGAERIPSVAACVSWSLRVHEGVGARHDEQRVNVIGDLLEPAEWLGDRYRVQVRIVVWQADRVLKVPWSALVREGEGWCVYVAESGRARSRAVSVGRQGEYEVQILEGLRAGEHVVRHPTDQIAEGVRISAR